MSIEILQDVEQSGVYGFGDFGGSFSSFPHIADHLFGAPSTTDPAVFGLSSVTSL